MIPAASWWLTVGGLGLAAVGGGVLTLLATWARIRVARVQVRAANKRARQAQERADRYADRARRLRLDECAAARRAQRAADRTAVLPIGGVPWQR